MSAYQESTLPLIQFYERRGLLVYIPAHGSPADIFERTLAALYGEWAAEAHQQT